MSKLKALLELKLIGWLLILLATFNVINSDFGFKVGVLLIVVNLLCQRFGWSCPLCTNKCKKEQ